MRSQWISTWCFPVFLLSWQAIPAFGRAAETAADWLPTSGRSEEWRKATAGCRARLSRVNNDDVLTRKYLPHITARCDMLNETSSITWRTLPAVEMLEDLLDDLAKGTEPLKRYAGQGLAFTYWSATMERIETIWIQVPPRFDPDKSYQLFIYYKCGGGIRRGLDGRATGGHRPTADMCRKVEDTFHAWSSLDIQVKGRRNAEVELAEASAALAREFAVDRARVFLSGYSDGGYTSLWLGSRFPDLVAGIAPAVANWQYQNAEYYGLANLPVLVVDGWSDGGYVEMNFSRFHTLSSMGHDVTALFGKHGHTYAPYESEATFARIMAWARTKKRNLYPKKIQYATWNLLWHRCYWLAIERMYEPTRAARVTAEVTEGNRIIVRADNIAAYKLFLDKHLVDRDQRVTVLTNGVETYRGPYQSEVLIELGPRPMGKFVKSPELPGDITGVLLWSTYAANDGDVFIPSRRWLSVRPTGGDKAAREAWAALVPDDAKADTEITEADIAACNLKIYGGPEINRFAARIAGDLPIKLEKGAIRVGKRVYEEPTHGVKFIHPNPLNPKKYVIVHAVNDPATARQHGFFDMKKNDEFRSGDCLVYGVRSPAPRYGPAHGSRDWVIERQVFDANWRVADTAPLGQATTRFDLNSLLRLKADAARAATGVDAAIMYRFPQRWNRWETSIRQGPVTAHDLGVTNVFPEYITIGEMRGEDLRALARSAAATTILFDKRDPAYDPKSSLLFDDIDPDRSYRVAIDYGGSVSRATAYRVDPAKLPSDFVFRNEKEFLAGSQANYLPLRRPRLADFEFTQALTRYFQKNGTVAPRRSCFDLVQYLENPEANDFCGYDWLHLNLAERGLFHLAFKKTGDQELLPPRRNSKKFAAPDLARGEATWDLSELDKKLPIRVTSTVRSYAIVAGDKASHGLAPASTKDGVVGRLTLFRVDLENRGRD
ncbi:MAG: hypothetical protein AB7K24_06190, partial [Gemmataceae bacterium]